MLRIERSANGQVVFTLSGRIQTEDIEQVRQLLGVETPGQAVMFDFAGRDAREPGCGDTALI